MNSGTLFLPDRTRLERDVRRLAVPRHPDSSPDALRAAEAYVADELAAAGLAVERQPFAGNGTDFCNVVGTRDGADAARPWVVVGAHFDSARSTPGADDNASGVAGLLEVARLLALVRPAATIQLVGFNLEEVQRGLGSRLGSRAYARRLRLERRRLAGALVLEMLGFTGDRQHVPALVRLIRTVPREGRFLGVVGDTRSRGLLATFARSARDIVPLFTLTVPFKGWLVPHSRMSDNARFWDEGFPSLMVTDTAFLRNPHYHRASDTPESLDYDFLTRATGAVAQCVWDLAR